MTGYIVIHMDIEEEWRQLVVNTAGIDLEKVKRGRAILSEKGAPTGVMFDLSESDRPYFKLVNDCLTLPLEGIVSADEIYDDEVNYVFPISEIQTPKLLANLEHGSQDDLWSVDMVCFKDGVGFILNMNFWTELISYDILEG